MSRDGSPSAGTHGTSVARSVSLFVLTSLVALLVLGVSGVFALRELGRREAVRDARSFALLAAQGIVEPNLENGVLTGRPGAIRRLDRVVHERILSERVVRVKMWTRDGRVVYSDEPLLVGARYPLGDDELEVFRTGGAHAELSDLKRPENRFERGQGELLEVYVPIRAPRGTPVLVELYERFDSVVAGGRRVWLSFLPALLGSLVLLWLVQVPLAWSLARRLQRSQRDREALLVQAIEASTAERRRIAADLHDGVVQDLAGISYSLAAASDAKAMAPADVQRTLSEAAVGTRQSIRRLRSLLVEIHPPNLRIAGLEPAISDLLAPLASRGLDLDLEVAPDLELGPEMEALLFRAAVEGLRNVERHAAAQKVRVRVSDEGERVRLTIRDDGRGFSRDEHDGRRDEGHVGLSLLAETVAYSGGTCELHYEPGQGTTLVVEVPRA